MTPLGRAASKVLRALILAFVVAICGRASAHDPFEITTDAHVNSDQLGVHTTLSLLTAGRACLTGTDASRHIEVAEFAALQARFEACARDHYRITSGGAALPVLSASASLGHEGDVELKSVYPRPTRSPVIFDALLLRRLVPRAGVVLTVTGARSFLGQKLLRPDDAVFTVPITSAAEAPGTPPLPSLGRYLLLGIEHILTGVDHLAFLLGLLLVCRRIRSVAILVTCFTIAHSITLALAALGVVALSPRIVEPLIAASIVVVGVDNLRRTEEPKGPWLSRWLISFGFGLIHGLGFAAALRQVGLGTYGTSVLGPLVAFNAGVELGQLSVAALLLALSWNIPRHGRFARWPRLASLGIAATGLFWLIERLIRA